MGITRIRKLLLILFFVMAILFSGALAEAQDFKIKVTASLANVREQPNVSSPVIAVLSAGTIVDSAGKEENWYKIKLPADIQTAPAYGYIHQSIIKVVEETKVVIEKEKVGEKEPPKPVIQQDQREEPRLPAKAPVRLQPERKRAELGFKLTAGHAWPSSEFFSDSFSVEGGVWLEITKNIAVEFSGKMLSFDSLGETGGLSAGSLSTAAVSLGLQWRFFPEKALVPFITAGGSYCLNKFSLDSEIVDSWDDLGLAVDEECDDSLAFFGGVGVDFFMADNIALTAGIKHVTSTAKGSWSLVDQLTDTRASGDIDSVKLSSFVLQAGIRFLF